MRARDLILLTLVAGVAGAQAQSGASPPAGSAAAGRALFLGSRAFQNRGAPCGACHALGGEGLAATASLGPELSGLSGMDLETLGGLLEALPFPSMTPVYTGRALTPAERADLAAYFSDAAKPEAPRGVRRFELLGALGAGVLLVVPAVASRRRKPSSRARLLARAYGAKGGAR